jgi:hypothetical protein
MGDNIKMGLKQVKWSNVDSIHLRGADDNKFQLKLLVSGLCSLSNVLKTRSANTFWELDVQ